MEPRGAEGPRPRAEHFRHRPHAGFDLDPDLVVFDLRQAGVRVGVATDLVPVLGDPTHLVGPLVNAGADQEEGRLGVVLAQELAHRRSPFRGTIVERQREALAHRGNLASCTAAGGTSRFPQTPSTGPLARTGGFAAGPSSKVSARRLKFAARRGPPRLSR